MLYSIDLPKCIGTKKMIKKAKKKKRSRKRGGQRGGGGGAGREGEVVVREAVMEK